MFPRCVKATALLAPRALKLALETTRNALAHAVHGEKTMRSKYDVSDLHEPSLEAGIEQLLCCKLGASEDSRDGIVSRGRLVRIKRSLGRELPHRTRELDIKSLLLRGSHFVALSPPAESIWTILAKNEDHLRLQLEERISPNSTVCDRPSQVPIFDLALTVSILRSKFQMRTPDFEYLEAEFDLLTSVQRAPNLLTRIQAGGPHLDFRCFSISSCRTLCYVKSGDATADESIYRFNLTSFKFGRHEDDGSGSTRHGLIVRSGYLARRLRKPTSFVPGHIAPRCHICYIKASYMPKSKIYTSNF